MKRALAALLLAGCLSNEHGHLGALRAGQRVDPPAVRLRAADALEGACGRSESRAPIVRRPYLQSVGDRSATIVWTSSSPDPERVEIETIDGELVASIEAREDETRYLRGAHQYTAHARGLSAASTYCYRVLDRDGAAHGPIGFRTAPAIGEGSADFLVFGDSGTGGDDQYALREQMETVPIDLVLHTGDLAYMRGTLAQLEANVFDVYGELFASFPFFPSMGNHDYATDRGGPYLEVFALPGGERWYSFDWGPVHLVALDTQQISAAQAAWLDRDLASTDQPWTIVYAHEPPYSSGAHGSARAFRSLFGPVLRRHRVPLVLSGHDHHYERTHPIDGTIYVVTGGGGSSTRKVYPSDFTAFAEDVVHFLSIHADRGELVVHAIDAEGTEFDAVRMVGDGTL